MSVLPAPARLSLDAVNDLSVVDFVARVGPVFERADWVVQAVAARRPFTTLAALHDAMMAAVRAASTEQQIAFLRGHPELAGRVARKGHMTADSIAEQGSLGLDRLPDAEYDRFQRLNTAYTAKFGFPFIICVRRQTRDALLDAFERRLSLSTDSELAAALDEIGHITRLRLCDRIEGPGAPAIAGRLSTHVLDTQIGRPAAGVVIDLFEARNDGWLLLKTARTNADGRTDAPLMTDGPLRIGRYELRFQIGAYFAGRGIALSVPAFLDVVPIRFGIAEAEGHYHVPLLATPWSFSTYRGS